MLVTVYDDLPLLLVTLYDLIFGGSGRIHLISARVVLGGTGIHPGHRYVPDPTDTIAGA